MPTTDRQTRHRRQADARAGFFGDLDLLAPPVKAAAALPVPVPPPPVPTPQAFTRSSATRVARRVGAAAGVAVVAAGLQLSSGPSLAHADPSSHDWYRLKMCESSNNYRSVASNGHYGAYQFSPETWRDVGGRGMPNRASKAEQDYRALYLYRMRGWQPWTCARIVGLRNDSDARSGVKPIRSTPSAPSRPSRPSRPQAPSAKIPAWPGTQYFYGDSSPQLRVWQLQMKRRGYPFDATGYFGEKTRAYVKLLQARNGLPAGGFIGPQTWRLAWTSKWVGHPAGYGPRS